MLALLSLRPGKVTLDLSAAGGSTTELPARAIASGRIVYGQSPPPRDPGRAPPPPAAPEGNRNPNIVAISAPAGPSRASAVALAKREARLKGAGISAARIVPVVRSFKNPIPPELARNQFDLVTLMFNYHDLEHLGVDRAGYDEPRGVPGSQTRWSLCYY